MEPALTTTRTERRTAVRRQPALGTIFRVTGSTPGLVWNISTGGVSLLVSNPPERGATMRGELATADGQTLTATFRVTHVSQLRTGDYVIGGPFDRTMTADEIHPFVGPS